MAKNQVNKKDKAGKSSVSKEYLVVSCGEGQTYAAMEPASMIIEYLSMKGSYEYDYDAYRVFDINQADASLRELTIHGTGHDPERPLYIKVTDDEGNILFDGYRTED